MLHLPSSQKIIFYCCGNFFITFFKDSFIHVNFIKLAEAAKEQFSYPHDFFVAKQTDMYRDASS
jgi:hypothetical protein